MNLLSLDELRRRPAAILVLVALILAAGFAAIALADADYRRAKANETRVQAEILAASVTAALDFGDADAAREAVEAVGANPQIRFAGVYGADGRRVAGYGRGGIAPPLTLDTPSAFAGELVGVLVPVMSGNERIGQVYLAAGPEPLSRRLTRYFLLVLLMGLAGVVILVLYLAQTALRRANRELAARAHELTDANAQLKVQVGERAKAEDQLRQAHKLQALGQLTGGIAHDFNNLLTVIQGSADMLRRPGLPDAKRVRYAEAVVQASERAAALTGQLLAFARRQPLQPEIVDLNELIEGMTDLLDRTLGERVRVVTDLAAGGCPVEADRVQLESALLNVAVNGRDAMPDGGELRISTMLQQDGGRSAIAVRVADTGSGMDEETLSRAIEPFFTTKTSGKGTGLGLSQVYGFVTQSGGDLTIESEEGRGTTVTIILPCSSGSQRRVAAEPQMFEGAGRTGRILLVEDNEEVGAFAETLLKELGHRVARAASAKAALSLIATRTFDVVFTDVVMPGMSGVELADHLATVDPAMPVILTTGYSDEIARAGSGGRTVLLKPYRLETLAAALDEALKTREAQREAEPQK